MRYHTQRWAQTTLDPCKDDGHDTGIDGPLQVDIESWSCCYLECDETKAAMPWADQATHSFSRIEGYVYGKSNQCTLVTEAFKVLRCDRETRPGATSTMNRGGLSARATFSAPTASIFDIRSRVRSSEVLLRTYSIRLAKEAAEIPSCTTLIEIRLMRRYCLDAEQD